jgi:GNAT superfamily N-acetyltransferase
MPRVAVRPAGAGDLEAIDRLLVRARRPFYDPAVACDAALGLDERAWAEYRRIVDERPGRAILVVADDGACTVGFAHAEAGAPGTTGELIALYVDPDRWRSGVGEMLMQSTLDWFRRRGCDRAALWVRDSNDRARAFYAAGGWEPDGTERVRSVAGGVAIREIGLRLSFG